MPAEIFGKFRIKIIKKKSFFKQYNRKNYFLEKGDWEVVE
jgi:hypothetical protein